MNREIRALAQDTDWINRGAESARVAPGAITGHPVRREPDEA
jgi:hypothetical protein